MQRKMKDNMADKYSLASLIERGGIYYKLPGANPKELLAGLIGLLPPIPSLDHNGLLREIMEREALVSTGIGRGIAFPHPRNPPIPPSGESDPLVALAFSAQPIDWNTHDGSRVDSVFLILSSSAKQHLGALSKLTFLCRQENFLSLIKAQAPSEEIIMAIRNAEAAWDKTE